MKKTPAALPPKDEKPTISVTISVKNEAHNIEDFFRTIEGITDELIIVDTGSTDDTIARIQTCIAAAPFPVVFLEKHFEQPFHYGIANNYAIRHATKEYVFKLDADERLTDAGRATLRKFLRERKPLAVWFNRKDDLVPHFFDPQDRLLKNGQGIFFEEDPENRVDMGLNFKGAMAKFSEPILHFQGRNHILRRPQRNLFQLELDIDALPRTRGSVREIIRGVFAFYYIFKKLYFRRYARRDGWNGFKYAFIRAWYKFLMHFFVAFKPIAKER